MSTEEYRSVSLASVEQDDGGLTLYVFMGIMAVTFVPLLILTSPVWVPLAVIGWLVVKAMNRWAK